MNGCNLERKSDLSFDFKAGTCATFTFNSFTADVVLMCFPDNIRDGRSCWTYVCSKNFIFFYSNFRFDGKNYKYYKRSQYDHKYTTSIFPNYRGQPFVCGSLYNAKTELLEPNTGWKSLPDYPYKSAYVSRVYYPQIYLNSF